MFVPTTYAVVGSVDDVPSRSWPTGIVPAEGRTPTRRAVVDEPRPPSFARNLTLPCHVAEPVFATQVMPVPGVFAQIESTSPNATVRPDAAVPKISSSDSRAELRTVALAVSAFDEPLQATVPAVVANVLLLQRVTCASAAGAN